MNNPRNSHSKRLLLISNSTQPGGGYLDFYEEALRSLLGNLKTVLFVPYALKNRDAYAQTAKDRFGRLGVTLQSLHTEPDPVQTVMSAKALFIGGGNTFRLLHELHTQNLYEPIRQRVFAGMPYIGTSAGVNVACPTIRTTNDMPIVQPPTFAALNLIGFQINPHYRDSDPGSTHMGETRETRLREYHEENDLPVIGLREGSWLHIADETVTLQGGAPARVFRKGEEPFEITTGTVSKSLLTV